MEGRRVSHRGQKYNPLFILFLCMVAAVIVMLIISITLGAKLGSANKKLKTAEAQVEELKQTVAQLEDDLDIARGNSSATPADPTGTDVPAPGDAPAPSDQPTTPTTPTTPAASSWLDLSGHNEIKVRPSSLLSGFTTYYTTANVNVRSGPGTNYDRIASAAYGTKVDVAARENGWSFVRIGSSYGWISSDYLSTTQPQPQTPAAPTTPSRPAEATSGNLNRP